MNDIRFFLYKKELLRYESIANTSKPDSSIVHRSPALLEEKNAN